MSFNFDSISLYSSNASKNSSFFNNCAHLKTVKSLDRENCFSCGAHICSNPALKVYKSKKMNFGSFMDVQQFYVSMLKPGPQVASFATFHPYLKERNVLIDWIFDVAEKLRLSFNSIHLSVYFLDYVMSISHISQMQFKLYATTSLMLAAKSIELDERIPFISKLRKYSSVTLKAEEIRKAEQNLITLLGWNLQFCTLFDVLEYYLSQGVLFSNDHILPIVDEKNALRERINHSNKQETSIPTTKEQNFFIDSSVSCSGDPFKQVESTFSQLSLEEGIPNKLTLNSLSEMKIFEFVAKMEKECIKLANLIMRENKYIGYENKRILGAACIGFLRKNLGLRPVWNNELEAISDGLKESDILPVVDSLEEKFSRNFENTRIPVERNLATARNLTNNIPVLLKGDKKENGVNYLSIHNQTKEFGISNMSKIPLSSNFSLNRVFSNILD